MTRSFWGPQMNALFDELARRGLPVFVSLESPWQFAIRAAEHAGVRPVENEHPERFAERCLAAFREQTETPA